MSFPRVLSCGLVLSIVAAAFGQVSVPVGREAAPESGFAPNHAARPAAYMIELTATPAAVAYAAARERALAKGGAAADAIADAASVRQLAAVTTQQAPFLSALREGDIDGVLLYAVQRVQNGVAAEMTPEEAARVATMPGVLRVTPIPSLTIDNTVAVSLVGAPGMWAPALGAAYRGDGIRIGIIDTGVDYTHLSLGGAGVYDPGAHTGASVAWNAKVVGGIDLAGDDYDAGSSDPSRRVPHPDPDPMDCVGHGTHVAATATGIGVRADGTVFSGPYGASLDPAAFRVGPGVAPAAKIYAIRVLGCSGSTQLVTQALDWAVDPNGDGNLSDHLDVVNLSLGGTFGETYWPSAAIAADNAVRAGLFVVASAGNSGKTHFIAGSPSVAARALSVAASVDSTDTVDAFAVTAPASIAGNKPALPSTQFKWTNMKSAVSADLIYPPSQRSGCEAFTPANAALLAGKIALLDWTDDGCKSSVRVTNAAAANAVAVLFAYTSATHLDISMGGAASIPAMITTSTVADALKAAMPVTVRFDPALLGGGSMRLVDDTATDMLADFSSRGPRAIDNLLKPEISAPGMTLYSARAFGGNTGLAMSGTSMAAPVVTGSIALLRQLHPDWTVEELKALAMNSATNDVYGAPSQGTPLESPAAAGAGRFSLADAAILDVLAYSIDNPGAVAVSFGFVEVPGQVSVERQFRVVNKSNTAAVVTLAYTPTTSVPGVSFDFPGGTTLSIPANGSVVARIRMTAVASQMKHARDPLLDAKQGGYPRYWLTEASGRIDLMRGMEPLRLPVHAIVRPASRMTVGKQTLNLSAGSGHAMIALSGDAFETGTSYPDDWVSLVAPFELQDTHSRKPSIPAAQNLRYVGITSDYEAKGGSIKDTTLYIGIAAWGSWAAPVERNYWIYFDTKNTTNKYQFCAFATNGATFLDAGDANDVHIAAICPYPMAAVSASCSSQWMNGFAGNSADTAVFNNSVVRFPVRASMLGLTDTNTRVTYMVVSYDPVTGAVLDATPRLSFDVAHSLNLLGTATTATGMYFDRATNALPVDWGAGDVGNSRGILLLHYFNVEGTRAEVVAINASGRHHAARH